MILCGMYKIQYLLYHIILLAVTIQAEACFAMVICSLCVLYTQLSLSP